MISSDLRSQIFEKKKKKNLAARIWAQWAKINPKMKLFCHFLEFGSYVLFEFVYNDSLRQHITSSGSKTLDKNF